MSTPLPNDARVIAAAWLARLGLAAAPANEGAPNGDLVPILSEFVALTIAAGQTLLIAVPDDELLPSLSNALDLALRPLCLVLPRPDFAAPIALRATLSLLKSRLVRGGESSCAAAWVAQQERVAVHADLWAESLAWSNGGKGRAWPAQVGELFPVCILPSALAETVAGAQRDVVVILGSERLQNDLPRLLLLGKRVLLLRDTSSAHPSGSALSLDNQEIRLFAELELLTQQLGEMELEFATAQAEMSVFTRRYYELVGARMTEHDQLQARIASLVAAKMPADASARQHEQATQAKAERSQRERMRFSELEREIEKPFTPSESLKRLFRHLAQKIHPDRAEGETDRAWRTELMSEANRAYRNGDEMVLREILVQWQEGPVSGASHPKGQTGQSLASHVAKVQRRLYEIETELNRLFASRLYELFLAAKLGKERGRDLLQEMADKLDAQIAEANQQLRQLDAC